MADFLIGFVSLAAKNDHVVLFRVRQRPFDGLHSVFDHHVRVRPLLHPGDDRVDDGHGVLIEIPAGKLDSKTEDPQEAAKRELLEETGAVAGELIELGLFLPACAYSDEAIHMYAAKNITFREQKLDEDEFLNVFTMPLEQAVSEVLTGKIPDAKTQTALLKVWLLHQKGKL